MDEFQRRVDGKLDKISDKLSEVHGIMLTQQVQIDRNTKDVEHHIKRTALLEVSYNRFETYIRTVHKVMLGGVALAATLLGLASKLGWL